MLQRLTKCPRHRYVDGIFFLKVNKFHTLQFITINSCIYSNFVKFCFYYSQHFAFYEELRINFLTGVKTFYNNTQRITDQNTNGPRLQ